MESLLGFDQSILLYINTLPHTPLGIVIASFLSIIGPLGLVAIAVAAAIGMYVELKNHWFLVPSLLSLFLSYVVSEEFLKPIIARPRPYMSIQSLFILDHYPGWSFPSTHTTVAFAGAFVISKYLPRYRIVWYILATLIGFSRMYLGAHYPSDVLAGVIVGSLCGFIGVRVGTFFHNEYGKRKLRTRR